MTIQSNFLYNKLNLQGLKSDEEAVWTNFFLQEYTETDIGKMNAKTNCKNYILTTRVKTKKGKREKQLSVRLKCPIKKATSKRIL